MIDQRTGKSLVASKDKFHNKVDNVLSEIWERISYELYEQKFKYGWYLPLVYETQKEHYHLGDCYPARLDKNKPKVQLENYETYRLLNYYFRERQRR